MMEKNLSHYVPYLNLELYSDPVLLRKEWRYRDELGFSKSVEYDAESDLHITPFSLGKLLRENEIVGKCARLTREYPSLRFTRLGVSFWNSADILPYPNYEKDFSNEEFYHPLLKEFNDRAKGEQYE